MSDRPETVRTPSRRVSCDGGPDMPPALGHPRVWIEIGESGYAECGYCDRRFVLEGGPADEGGKHQPQPRHPRESGDPASS